MQLEIDGKSFGGQPVLGPISLRAQSGEVLALTGPSGIGKSTLARIVAGLDRGFQGRVTGVGRIGMVFQEPTLLPWRSALDNITIATGCALSAARNALESVELGSRADAFPGQLSLGQQRRVALARALAARPDTLILDEAFASLDGATAGRMRALVRRILDGAEFRTLLVTHDLTDAAALADRVLVLNGAPAGIALDHALNVPRTRRDPAAELIRIREVLSAASDS